MAINKFLAWWGSKQNSRKIATIFFVTAICIRATALFIVPDAHVSSNAKESILAGAELIQQGEFINNPEYPMLVPPLTAIFVAAIHATLGEGLLQIKLAQIVLDATLVVLIFYLGVRLFGYATASLGTAIILVYPFSVFLPLYIGTELLFGFFLAVSILTVIKGLNDDKTNVFLLSGMALGLATLTRGTTLFLPIFLVGFFIWFYRGTHNYRPITKSAVFLLGYVIILSPWVVRNFVVHDAFIPASTSSGPLLHGSSEDFWLIADRERELPKYFEYLRKEKGFPSYKDPSWVEKDRFYRRAAIEKYKERWDSDPMSFIPFFFKKFTRLWYATESGSNTKLILIINLPIYLFALFGLWRLLCSGNRLAMVIVVLLGYFVAIHVAVFAYFRYITPIMPYIILLAAYGVMRSIRHPWIRKPPLR